MPRPDPIPCVGYVYTGAFLLRAKVQKDLIVAANGLTHIDGEVPLLAWYTYRRVENAVARLHHNRIPGDFNLNIVAYSPELQAELKKDSLAKPRLTPDHIFHMLTAGKFPRGHVPTDEELKPYLEQRDAFMERMQKANEQATKAA